MLSFTDVCLDMLQGSPVVERSISYIKSLHIQDDWSSTSILSNFARKTKFEWKPVCTKTFQELNKYMHSMLSLWNHVPCEPQFLYLSINSMAVITVLVKEATNAQLCIYYASKLFVSVENKYIENDKSVSALIIVSWKLHPYFHAHKIVVLIDKLLKHILLNSDASKRMVKYAIKLSEFINWHKRASPRRVHSLQLWKWTNGGNTWATMEWSRNVQNWSRTNYPQKINQGVD